MIYIITFLLIIGLSFILRPSRLVTKGDHQTFFHKNRKKYCWVISIWLLFLLVFRHCYIGTDTQNYFKAFTDIGIYGVSLEDNDTILSTEIGFYALNLALNYLNLPFRFLLLISAGFYISTISYFIYKYSKVPWISYFVFITFGFLLFNTTMRQCFALSFCMWAYFAIIHSHRLLGLLLIISGMLFHSTAMVFLITYAVPYLHYDKRSFLLIFLLSVIIYFLSSKIFQTASEIMGKNYETRETTGYFSILLSAFFCFYGYIYRKRLADINKNYFFLIILSIILFPLTSLNPAFFRIRMYFTVFLILYIPNLTSLNTKNYKILYPLIFIYGIYNFTIGNINAGIRVFPYVFYWEDYKKINPEIQKEGLYPPD